MGDKVSWQTLNRLLHLVTASLDLRRTVQTLADAARELLDADEALVLLREQDSTELHAAAASGADVECLRDTRTSVADPDLQAALARAIIRSVDPTDAHPLAAWLAPCGDQIHALAAAPLRLVEDLAKVGDPLMAEDPVRDENLLGLLLVGRRLPQGFVDEDLPLLQALALGGALAIRNARLFERERDQAARLRTLEQMQFGFISDIAHQLRTPLTCIRTSVDLLQAGPAPEVQQELWRTIDDHANRLEELVSDLLETARLEVGQIALTRQPTDLRLVVERAARAMALIIQQKGQHLEIAAPEEPLMADVDRRLMEHALTNLLSNAHKFTPRGGHIWVELGRQDAEGPARGKLVISVADDGPGVPGRYQPYLFQRFYTVPEGKAKTGLGLGLYITRLLVELHGGRVWVISEPGQGSTFSIAVPALPS